MNAWKPAGYPSMSPYLICKHAERLIGFLKDAFGGVLTQVRSPGCCGRSAVDGKADIERSSLGGSFHPKQKLADGCAVARRARLRPAGLLWVSALRKQIISSFAATCALQPARP
jgi:hypothetical protein